MNAVATKPRAKKADHAVLPKRIGSTLNSIRLAQAKLAMALEAAEPGSPVEVVLNQLCLSWLPSALEPVFRPSLTKGGAEAAYEALFPPLAVIEGVIALASGTVLEHTLREGHALLDAAHTELDSCGELTKLLPDGPTEEDEAELNFLRGRDLAVKMLQEGHGFVGSDDTAAKRWYREGNAQQRFVKSYIQQVMNEPALLDGFSAVLSAAIGEDCLDDFEGYGTLPMAEFQAGPVGADGTQTESSAETPASQTPLVQEAIPADGEQYDPYCVILQARDVAQVAADIETTDMYWGIHSLIEKAVEKVEQAHSNYEKGLLSKDLHDEASNELAGLLGIIRAVNTDSVDDGLLYAVETLVTVAKTQIDADNEHIAAAGVAPGISTISEAEVH